MKINPQQTEREHGLLPEFDIGQHDHRVCPGCMQPTGSAPEIRDHLKRPWHAACARGVLTTYQKLGPGSARDNGSGSAGDEAHAVPIQQRVLLNSPEPIELFDSIFAAALKVSEASRLVLMLEALGREKDAARARERHQELSKQFAEIFPKERGEGNDD